MKAKERFINACFVVWGNRASGKKIGADSVIKRFHIGNNASKFLNSIKGESSECSREHFAELYQKYSDWCKEHRARNEEIVPSKEEGLKTEIATYITAMRSLLNELEILITL